MRISILILSFFFIINGNPKLEKLLINKEWDSIPTYIGNFMLQHPDQKLSILEPIGNINGKSISTLNAVFEFLRIAEKCEETDSINYNTYGQKIRLFNRKLANRKPDTTSYENYHLKLQYHKDLLYSWIGSDKYYKKDELSNNLKERIEIILSARKKRYQSLISNPIDKPQFVSEKKTIKKDTVSEKLKEAEIFALNQDSYKKLKLESIIAEAMKEKKICEKRLEYSKKYNIKDTEKISQMKYIINLDMLIEQKLSLYKRKTGSNFDTANINIDYNKKLHSLKKNIIKTFLESKIPEIEKEIVW